jgi:uncharacterized membrane protein YgcG
MRNCKGMLMKKREIIILFFLFLLPLVSYADDIPQRLGYINDFAGVISLEHKAMLNKTIEELEQKTLAEIVVVTTDSASPYGGKKYSKMLFDEWKVGKKNNQDSGLIFLLVIKENRYYFNTGEDLEAVFSNDLFGKIGDNYFTPPFRIKHFDEGICYGVPELVKVIMHPIVSLSEKQLKSKDYLKELTQKFNSCIDNGRYFKALIFSLQAVEISSNIYGNDSPEKAQFLNAAGNAYFTMKKYRESEPFFKESLEIYEKKFPSDSTEVVNARKCLAAIYALEKKYTEAKPLFENALNNEERLLGKDHQITGATRKYSTIIKKKLIRPVKTFLVIFVLFYFFTTILGVLKGAEKKAVVFNSFEDCKINSIIGLIFLSIAIFLSIKVPSNTNFAYVVFFLVVFSLINIFVAFHINRGLKFIPLVVGLSRTIIVFFISIFISVLKGMIFIRRIKKRNSIIKEESTEKEINVEQNWISDFGEGLADFIGSVLINKIVVTAFQAYKISEKWPEIIKDIYKKHKGFCEEDDKALNAGIGSGEVEEDTDEDISQETDNNSYEEAPSETAVNDLESAYNILGISENASIEEIKSAYRKKMMEYHPDRTGGLGEKLRVLAEEEAKKINNAYEKIMKEKGAA